MNNKLCIWGEMCGMDCFRCEFFSPFDESEFNEAYFRADLNERASVYEEMIREYSDGNIDFGG